MIRPRPLLRAGVLLATLALSACGSMAPSYQRPALPVAPSVGVAATDGGTDAFGNAVPRDMQWQAFFTDPVLQGLIRTALENNRDLRAALLNMEQYRSQVDSTDANRWPSLNAGASVTRQTTVGVPLNTVYNAGLLVTSYELDLFGRLRSQTDTAMAQYLASREASKAVQLGLIGNVAAAYYALQADTRLLALAQETARTRQQSLDLTRLRLAHGAATQIDLGQADNLLQGARASLAQARRQTLQDENALALLLGSPLDEALRARIASAAVSADVPLPAPPAQLPSELLLRRPDVAQAEQLLLAANANIGAARANFFPRISLTASAGYASTDLGTLFQSGNYAFAVAPQILQPLFDAGRNRAVLQGAQAARDVAVAQYEKAIQSAFRDVADALAARSTLVPQLQAQQAQTQAAADVARLTTLRRAQGVASALEDLDAQRSLYSAQQSEIALRAQVLQNLATLYRALGGGWQPADTPATPAQSQ